jgi:hypothetical protein
VPLHTNRESPVVPFEGFWKAVVHTRGTDGRPGRDPRDSLVMVRVDRLYAGSNPLGNAAARFDVDFVSGCRI